MYLTIASIVGSMRLELVDTTDYDVTVATEYFIGCLPEDSKGVRVRVLGQV
jgi:hypothetical protein